MARHCATGLTKTERGYCRTIGYYEHDGKRVPRKFRLGYDRAQAMKKARALTDAWDEVPGDRGKKVWTEDAIQAALDSTKSQSTEAPATADIAPRVSAPVRVFADEVVPPPTAPVTFTLLTALDEFSKYFSERSDIGQVHRDGTKSRITSIKQHIEEIVHENNDGTKVWLKDLPIAAVDTEWLARIRNRLTSRPMTKHIYDTPKPLSIDSVKNWLMTLGMAFDWFDMTRRIGWTAPHARWRANFVLKKKQEYALRTPEERDNEGKPKPAYTVDELVKIYKNCTPLGRKYLVMGLTLGWAQEAIRSFRKCHLVMIEGEYYIDRRRGKTGVEGFWWVWPELAQLLVKSIAQTPANVDGLAFLTEDGFPLVHGKCDTIRLTWERCLNSAPSGIRKLPFGRIKKCGAQIVENLASHETAQLFLAHRTQTVAARNYVGADVNVGMGKNPYEKLHDAQREMYSRLKPLLFDTIKSLKRAEVSLPTTSTAESEAA